MGKNLLEQKERQRTTVFETRQVQQQQNGAMARPMAMNQTEKPPIWAPSRKKSIFDKSKSKNLQPLSQGEVHANISDRFMDDSHQNLLDMVTSQLKYTSEHHLMDSDAGPSFVAALTAVKQYAELNLRGTKRADQAAKIRDAREKLKEYSDNSKGQSDYMDPIMERYTEYFSALCDGALSVSAQDQLLRRDGTGDNTPELHQPSSSRKVVYADRTKDPLFTHEPSMNDIAQKSLGDCYLQAAVSSLVMNSPDEIKRCMKDNGDGTVTVRFFQKYRDLADEEKLKTDSPNLVDLWTRTDYERMSDDELIFKLLQRSECPKFDQEIFTPGDTRLATHLNSRVDKNCSDESKQLYLFSAQATAVQLSEYAKAENAEQTRTLSELLANNPKVKTDVIDYMKERMRADPKPATEEIHRECLIRLTALFPPLDAYSNQLSGIRLSMFDTPEQDQAFRNTLKAQTGTMDRRMKSNNDRLVPIYVTVTKEVPVFEDNNEDAYTKECLWMQMLEKAYAASGLHTRDRSLPEERKKKLDDKHAKERREFDRKKFSSEQEKAQEEQVLKDRQEQELREETKRWRHSFEGIVGGYSGAFLERLTGKKETKQIFSTITATNFRDSFPNLGEDIKVNILDDLEGYLKKKHEHSYTKKDAKGTKTRGTYCTQPLYIEDIQELLNELKEHTRPSWLSIETFNKLEPRPDKEDLVLSMLTTLESQANNGQLKIMHHPMSDQYTDYAKATYDKIEKHLDAGIPVNLGTARFIPKGVNATGRNGEAEQGGLVETHAYSVLMVYQMYGRYFVRLRNPWATGEMGYVTTVHSDGTISWSSHRIDRGASGASGQFDIELNHLLSRIGNIDFNGTLPPAPAVQGN